MPQGLSDERLLTSVDDPADAVGRVRAPGAVGMDGLGIHGGASFVDSGCKTQNVLVQTSSMCILSCTGKATYSLECYNRRCSQPRPRYQPGSKRGSRRQG